MGTLTGQSLVDRAWVIAQDSMGGGGTRWPGAECLPAINDGQRELVTFLPSACIKATIATLVVGTRQTLTGLGLTDGVQFLKMPRNYAANGTTVGRAVIPKPMGWLDESRPNWHTEAAGEVVHTFFDAAEPKTFYNWPPASGTTKGEIVYYAVPTDLASLSSTIGVDDIHANALQYYLLFRMFSKNSVFTKAPQLAGGFYALFLQLLGVRDAKRRANDANLQNVSDGAGMVGPGGTQ